MAINFIDFSKIYNCEFSYLSLKGKFVPIDGAYIANEILTRVGISDDVRNTIIDCQLGHFYNRENEIIHHYNEGGVAIYFLANYRAGTIEILFGDSDIDSSKCYGGFSWRYHEIGIWYNQHPNDVSTMLYVMFSVIQFVIERGFSARLIDSIEVEYGR